MHPELSFGPLAPALLDRPTDDADAAFMRRALDLAWHAAGRTEPNPMVGAVLVRDGVVVGEGHHQRSGEAHAESIALAQAGELAQGATLYVTLEPCSHHGHTPPCADAIVDAGVARVVVATRDPDPRVNGRGLGVLTSAGVEVTVGGMPWAGLLQNLGYHHDRLSLPGAVTLKMAVSMDGKIARAPGRRDRITGDESRLFVHRLRALHDAILVGVDTAIIDSPRLDCRHLPDDPAARSTPRPMPVVLDTQLRLSAENRWAAERKPFVVVCGHDAAVDREAALTRAGATVLRCDTDDNRVSPGPAVDALQAMGLNRILVEGGAGVFSSFMRAGIWDAFYLFQSNQLFGEDGVPLYRGDGFAVDDARLVRSDHIGEDALHRLANTRRLESVARLIGVE